MAGAMTPIKEIYRYANDVYTVDHSNMKEHMATCPTVDKSEWLAWSLGQAHGVPVVQGRDNPMEK